MEFQLRNCQNKSLLISLNITSIMIKKAVLILTVIFITQILFSCIMTCDCPDIIEYNVSYESVKIKALNTSGFQYTEVADSVYKNAFGLEIIVLSDLTELRKIESSSYNLGFNSAQACSCLDNTYNIPDPILAIEIFVVDTEINHRINVTNKFEMPSYDNETIPINQMIQTQMNLDNYWINDFHCQLINSEGIPNSVIFVMEIHLESGIILSDETSQVNFYK